MTAEIQTDECQNRRTRFISISTGRDHLVALTSNGRAFASPSSLLGNSHGQLAVRKVTVLGEQIVNLVPDPRINEVIRETAPPARLDPLLLNSTEEIRLSSRTPVVSNQTLPTFIQPQLDHDPTVSSELEKQIRFCTTLHQIPSLRSLTITQIVAGERHTLARTAEGLFSLPA
jgi:alpha-tubulin suppressor-like RCC1 family protein